MVNPKALDMVPVTRMGGLNSKSINMSRKITIVNTGGTISSTLTNDGNAINRSKKIASTLRPRAIHKTNSPYFINSENTEINHVLQLLDKLLHLLKNNHNKIVILHGTDAMDHVINMISEEPLQTLNNPHLIQKIKALHKLIKEKEAVITFTGANTNKAEEARANINTAKLSCQTQKPGIYLAFASQIHSGTNLHKIDREGSNDFTTVGNALNFEEEGVLVYRLNTIRSSPHDLLEQLAKMKESGSLPNAIKFIFYHSSTANVNPGSKYNALDLIKKVSQEYPTIRLIGETENKEPLKFGQYAGSRGFGEYVSEA